MALSPTLSANNNRPDESATSQALAVTAQGSITLPLTVCYVLCVALNRQKYVKVCTAASGVEAPRYQSAQTVGAWAMGPGRRIPAVQLQGVPPEWDGERESPCVANIIPYPPSCKRMRAAVNLRKPRADPFPYTSDAPSHF